MNEIQIKNKTIKENGFITINYDKDSIIIKDIINKKSRLFHLTNTILTAKKFILMKF